MSSIRCSWTVVVSALIAFLVCADVSRAQDPEVGLDQAKCAELQSRIDAVMEVSNSTTMSDSDKVAALAKVWGQALTTMLKSTANDPDAAKIAREMADSVKRVITSAGQSSGSPGDAVSSDAKRGADILKSRLRPYLAVMKLMCPDLVIPNVVK